MGLSQTREMKNQLVRDYKTIQNSEFYATVKHLMQFSPDWIHVSKNKKKKNEFVEPHVNLMTLLEVSEIWDPKDLTEEHSLV